MSDGVVLNEKSELQGSFKFLRVHHVLYQENEDCNFSPCKIKTTGAASVLFQYSEYNSVGKSLILARVRI